MKKYGRADFTFILGTLLYLMNFLLWKDAPSPVVVILGAGMYTLLIYLIIAVDKETP